MSSDDSDDEPLAVLASKKKTDYEVEIFPIVENKRRKNNRFSAKKVCDVSIELQHKDEYIPVTIERPTDVWLYLKDMNPNGPYSCLLCSEWFLHKTKIVIHYVVNHKKDFCGICRYFVPDRELWHTHIKFHIPWNCSQCPEVFTTEELLREHFSSQHRLVHCRLCYTRLTDGEDYNTHLFQKHSVTNTSSINNECFWEIDQENLKYHCILCSKDSDIQTYSNHYMAYHHMTLKCLAPLISGKNWNFPVHGAEITIDFIHRQLKAFEKFGYLDLDKKPDRLMEKEEEVAQTQPFHMLSTMVKEECGSEAEEITDAVANDDGEVTDSNQKNDGQDQQETNMDHMDLVREQITKLYKGDDDFDSTQVELIMMQKCYCDYVNDTLNKINCNIMPQTSTITYGSEADHLVSIYCDMCKTEFKTYITYTQHMIKMHGFKMGSFFSCRVCATTFDTYPELEQHVSQELKDFEDLWICQFCDKEFDNREDTRVHLTEHWEVMEYDNCFSPHLGFKCRYCPTLFWNETDREIHQVRVHVQNHAEDFYKCEECGELLSDKVWFIHHYLTKHIPVESTATDITSTFLLKCCICSVVLQTVDDVRNHFNRKHPEARKVFCSLDTCRYKPFSHKKSFQLHLKSFHSTKKRPEVFACQYCGKEFNNHRSCSAHTHQAHGAGRFNCTICQEALMTADERKIHYLLLHPGRHPFQCRDCDKSFQYKSSLYLHRKEHAPDKPDYKCSYCNKIFLKRDSFREHVMIHEGPKHACSYCPMVFVQRSNMLRHERRHTGERPYACQFCPKTFSDKGACSSHSRTHQKMPAFPCMYCGQQFAQKSKLTYHIRKHTGENLETCPHVNCGKIFTSPCSLREHLKIHERRERTGQEPVKCPLCSKSYRDEKYMMRHLRATHTNTAYHCPICKKKLHSPSYLRDHVVSHSGAKAYKCKQCSKSYNVKRTMIRHLRRRHGLKSAEATLSEFYTKLDPRECNLNLDEATMNSVFGPPKPKPRPNAVNFTKLNKLKLGLKADYNLQAQEMEMPPIETVQVKVECEEVEDEDMDGGDLQPTDFVSVKIEGVERDQSEGESEEEMDEED